MPFLSCSCSRVDHVCLLFSWFEQIDDDDKLVLKNYFTTASWGPSKKNPGALCTCLVCPLVKTALPCGARLLRRWQFMRRAVAFGKYMFGNSSSVHSSLFLYEQSLSMTRLGRCRPILDSNVAGSIHNLSAFSQVFHTRLSRDQRRRFPPGASVPTRPHLRSVGFNPLVDPTKLSGWTVSNQWESPPGKISQRKIWQKFIGDQRSAPDCLQPI